jgi:hypothetical protein
LHQWNRIIGSRDLLFQIKTEGGRPDQQNQPIPATRMRSRCVMQTTDAAGTERRSLLFFIPFSRGPNEVPDRQFDCSGQPQ